MNLFPKSLPVLFAATLAPCLAGQSFQAVPGHADLVDGHQSTSLPFGQSGFRTQLLVAPQAIAANGAVLTGLRLRADRSSLPMLGVTVPNVTVQISHSSRQVGAMSDDFSVNLTGSPVSVFQGTVDLPGYQDGAAGPLPWDIVITFQQPFTYDVANGQLLIDIVGNNPAGAFPEYWLDAVEPGGSATVFGQEGALPSGDFLDVGVATGNSLDPRLLTIGRTVDYWSGLFFSSLPGVLALGTDALPTPVDMGPLGAPGNSLYLDPIFLWPHNWQQSFIGWYSTFSLNVPNVAALIDVRVYGQSVVVEPNANALGLVFSRCAETRIGDPSATAMVQQLDAEDPAATLGRVLDFGFGFGPPSYGAVAFQLEGVFF